MRLVVCRSGGNDDDDGLEHQDKVSLGEIVRFGVKQVLSDDKGAADAYAAISDEDIESILQKGTILNSSSTAVASNSTPSQNVEVLPTGAEFEQTMRENEAQSLWLFDGHDYSAVRRSKGLNYFSLPFAQSPALRFSVGSCASRCSGAC